MFGCGVAGLNNDHTAVKIAFECVFAALQKLGTAPFDKHKPWSAKRRYRRGGVGNQPGFTS